MTITIEKLLQLVLFILGMAHAYLIGTMKGNKQEHYKGFSLALQILVEEGALTKEQLDKFFSELKEKRKL